MVCIHSVRRKDATIPLTLDRYIKTPIIGDPMDSFIQSAGIAYAAVEDAAAGLLKLVTDEKINGNVVQLLSKRL